MYQQITNKTGNSRTSCGRLLMVEWR